MFLLSTLITKRSTQVKYLSIFRSLALVIVCNPSATTENESKRKKAVNGV